MISVRELAHALGGVVVGRHHVACPGPGHSHGDRSLSVTIDADDAEGFRVHSFAGDPWRECRDHVRARLNLPAWRPTTRQADAAARLPRAVFRLKPSPREDDAARTAFAVSIFDNAKALRGTVGETYLRRRIRRDFEWSDDLRFDPACARKVNGKIEQHPAIIALMRNIMTNQEQAIQRIFLLPDGYGRLRDSMGKATLGPAAGAVVKLSPDEEATLGLGLAEGIETGLTMLALGWKPIWATVGTSVMAAFPVLNGIEALTVFADHDANGAGEVAAAKVITRWRAAGRAARGIKRRVVGQDWNDTTLRSAA